MPCIPLTDKHGRITGWACRRRGTPKPRCYICGKVATSFCDYHISLLDTCDRPMCNEHRAAYPDDEDYCLEHDNEIAIHRSRLLEQQAEKILNDTEED